MDWKLFGTGAIVSECHKQSQPLYTSFFFNMQSVGTEVSACKVSVLKVMTTSRKLTCSKIMEMVNKM